MGRLLAAPCQMTNAVTCGQGAASKRPYTTVVV